MTPESENNLRLEIGHVLFIDLVGYSKLLIEEQKERLSQLTEIVLATAQVRAAPNEQLVRLPTGDGMALVFRNSSEEPARCALEIAQALKAHPEIAVRMGIHSGPVSEVSDVSGRTNIAGAGINMAQRVMDCGDAGHILLSQRVADDLAQYRQWASRLHDLGECEVKHGVRIGIANLYNREAGNSQVPRKLEAVKKHRAHVRCAEGAIVLLVLAAIATALVWPLRKPASSTSVAPEKSVAVLPFENLSRDPDNAFFAEGIQDEILTRLSKIAALKVISRTSTQKYKSIPENLREIGKQLGVAHIVEGSVQKIADAVHINVQLIRAADDGHVWAESYDRKLDDIFVVEGEVAQKVAAALNATLTGDERQRLSERATSNPAAYEAYLRGVSLLREDTDAMIRAAIDAFDEAVRLDPQFALAWARLAEENALLYFYYDTTAARRATAERCVLKVEQLQPQLQETHLARAYFQYWGMRDYKGARDLLLQLRLIWPGNADIIQALAWISARIGDWQTSNSYFEQATTLNPRDLFLRTGAAFTRMDTRDFSGAQRLINDALGIWPNEPSLLGLKALVLQATGALDEAQAAINQLKGQTDNIYAIAAISLQARLRRQPAPALQIFEGRFAQARSESEQEAALWFIGQFQDLAGDKGAAQVSYSRLREMTEKRLQRQPENIGDLSNLAVALAALGDRDAALRNLDKAAALAAHDARDAPALEELRIRIQVRFGEKDRALSALPSVLHTFYGSGASVPLTPALLRLDPDFDPLRGEPGFQKLASDALQSATPAMPTIPEKSIAVLPFENLSANQENGFFADGVQDEILTDLAKVADLKVISRTSVINYRQTTGRNLGQIGQELRVAHVLEGSVQRAGNRVRVNAQLVDTRTDTHLWAQTYDRDLADVFAIQSEIAQAIAEQLQAKLSPNEKKAIEQPPTTDLAAFDLYSRAKSLLLTANFSGTAEPDVRKAIELLDEAVKRDPSFFDAYCQLAYAHETLYAITGSDHTPARLALAEAAVLAATRLRPDAAETHLARAQYLYYGLRDYAGALAELEIARQALPNDPRLLELTGYILRRRGQQEEGLQNLQRAVELDPRNFFTLQQIAASYQILGRHAEAIATLDRAIAIVPDNAETRATRAALYVFWKADTRPLHQTIDATLAQGPTAIVSAAPYWFFCALAERDPAAAERALVALGDNPCWFDSSINLSRSFGDGLLARMTKDEARARTAFEAARAQQEKIVQAQPDYGPALCVLGLIDAALGRKDLALDEGRRAIALTPLEKDVNNGSRVLQYFAITAAWAGEKELALQQLEAGLRAPAASSLLSYGALKLHPVWDPLRDDPRFEKIVADLAPKDAQP